MAGDRATTKDLMTRLERHYIKPSQDLPGGIFVSEVGWNGGASTNRCDAIYVGFTSTSGRILIGHEVKASRADWLHELDQLHKADAWADQCHEWWLVTVLGVVHEGELPAGWGLMVPGNSTTRMKVLHPARRWPERQPSWDAVRSILARQDTLRAGAISDGVRKATEKAWASVENEVERRVQARSGDSPQERERREYLAALLRTSGSLTEATAALVGRYGPISSMRRHWERFDEALREAAAATKPQQQKAGA